MTEPAADRPVMPGYGILPPDQGSGLLPWAEAEHRLTTSHDYWVATVRPDGRPHVMPVWGVWEDGQLWFSSGRRSRKARNVEADPRCTVTTDDARNPVVVDGVAARITRPEEIAAFVTAMNEKYESGMTTDFQDPEVNGTYVLTPERVIAMSGGDFTGSPTRWRFPGRTEPRSA
jgi:PPOX class probable F420-dependent enzyme